MNLFSNFSVMFFNFSGYINKQVGIFYYFDYSEKGKNEECKKISNFELEKVFDDFYGGSMKIESQNVDEDILQLRNIPLRCLYFEENGRKKLVAIGHVQKDLWILKTKSTLLTEKEVVEDIISNYLIATFKKFPRSIDIFISTLKDNSYDICKLLKDSNIDPLDYWEIFEKIAKKYIL